MAVPNDTVSETAKQALACARAALAAGHLGSRHGVRYGEVSYTVERDGIYRHLRGPDGQNWGCRRIP